MLRVLVFGWALFLGLATAHADTPWNAGDQHAVTAGATALWNGDWYPAPAVRGELGWLRRYGASHGYYLRLEGGGSLVESYPDGREQKAYTTGLTAGVREWLGPRKRGFVDIGLRFGLVFDIRENHGRERQRKEIYFQYEILTLNAGVTLGRHHDVDLYFTATFWGYPSGGGVGVRFPLWHRFGVGGRPPTERKNARGPRPPGAERMKQQLTRPR